jgi:hypothetical protein
VKKNSFEKKDIWLFYPVYTTTHLRRGNQGTSHAEATTYGAEIASNTNKFFLDTAYNADIISVMGGDSRENTQ